MVGPPVAYWPDGTGATGQTAYWPDTTYTTTLTYDHRHCKKCGKVIGVGEKRCAECKRNAGGT